MPLYCLITYIAKSYGVMHVQHFYNYYVYYKKCIRLKCNASPLEHCETLAKNLKLFMFNDLIYISIIT